MKNQLFGNETILSWLQYYADNTPIDLEQIKMMDITKKNKNIIPTVESHKAVLAFVEAGDTEIFYRMWQAGLGECEVWYNDGSDPTGAIRHDKLKDMIDRGINASAAMLVVNSNARNTSKIGLDENYRNGAQKVGDEIRSIIINKMEIGAEDTVCVIGGGTLAIEAAFHASEGDVIAVEYNNRDRSSVEDGVEYYDLRNVTIHDRLDSEVLKGFAAPAVAFISASASMEKEIEALLSVNPQVNLVIYTLDLSVAGAIRGILENYGIKEAEVIQVSVQKLNSKNAFEVLPAPWIITGKSEE